MRILRPFPLLLAALPVLPACMPTAPAMPPAMPPATCDEAALSAELTGRDAALIDPAAFPGPVRIIRPGDMVTMDYNPNRINVRLDAQDRVASVTCG